MCDNKFSQIFPNVKKSRRFSRIKNKKNRSLSTVSFYAGFDLKTEKWTQTKKLLSQFGVVFFSLGSHTSMERIASVLVLCNGSVWKYIRQALCCTFERGIESGLATKKKTAIEKETKLKQQEEIPQFKLHHRSSSTPAECFYYLLLKPLSCTINDLKLYDSIELFKQDLYRWNLVFLPISYWTNKFDSFPRKEKQHSRPVINSTRCHSFSDV